MHKLFPLLLIIAAGCETTGRNLFRPTTNAGCAAAPCDASCGGSKTSNQILPRAFPVTEGPVTEGPVTEGPVTEGPVTEGPVYRE